MRAKLVRYRQGPHGIFGALTIDGVVSVLTLEHPYKSIPANTYYCARDHSGRHQYWKLLDVEGRSGIEIHTGNTAADTEGCILVGLGLGEINGVPGIVNSRDAIEVLLDYIREGSFYLDIVEVF